jgi:DNA-binding transcriptional regulator GbsR (MarR family)
MAEFADRVVEILRCCRYGLTAQEVAERLGTTPRKISSGLSKLVAYGVVKRTMGRIAPDDAPRAIYGAISPAPATKTASTIAASSQVKAANPIDR